MVDNRKSMRWNDSKRVSLSSFFSDFVLGLKTFHQMPSYFTMYTGGTREKKLEDKKKRNHLRKSIIYLFLFCATFFFCRSINRSYCSLLHHSLFSWLVQIFGKPIPDDVTHTDRHSREALKKLSKSLCLFHQNEPINIFNSHGSKWWWCVFINQKKKNTHISFYQIIITKYDVFFLIYTLLLTCLFFFVI